MMATSLLLADVGGTHVRLRQVSPEGEVVNELSEVGSGVGDGTIRSLMEELNEVVQRPGVVPAHVPGGVRVVITSRGLSAGQAERDAIRALAAFVNATRVTLVPDGAAAYIGCLGARPGVVVTVGTGTIAVTVDHDGRARRLDGWGQLLGDVGSGYRVGLEGLRSACRWRDGSRGGSEMLRDDAVRIFGPIETLAEVLRPLGQLRNIARFAERVVAAARLGDVTAGHILDQAARELAELATDAAALVSEDPEPARRHRWRLCGRRPGTGGPGGGLVRRKLPAGTVDRARLVSSGRLPRDRVPRRPGPVRHLGRGGPVRAGFGWSSITPPLPCRLAGYARREALSRQVAQPLRARSIVLDNGQARVGWVICDILEVNRSLVADVRAAVEATGALAGDDVMVSATHTHAGPDLERAWEDEKGSYRQAQARYRAFLPYAVASSLVSAVEDLAPSSLAWAEEAVYGVGAGRRGADARPQRLSVVTARREGELRGMVIVYPCHGTVMGPGNLAVSGDVIGAGVEALEAGTGAPGRCAWAQGAAGDISTRATRRERARARRNVWARSSPPPPDVLPGVPYR